MAKMRTFSWYCFTCMTLLADNDSDQLCMAQQKNGKQREHACSYEMHSQYYCRNDVHELSLGQGMYTPRVAQKVVFQRRVEESVLD